MKKFKIQKKAIDNNRVFIVAEIGINHLGSYSLCKKMINAAINTGCDAVKLQIINADESYSKSSQSYNYFKKYTLKLKDLIKLNNYFKNKIILFATPGDFDSLAIIKKLNFPIIKISSGLLTNIPLIKAAAKLNKPMILSTGMAFEKDLGEAIKAIKSQKNNKIYFLECTSLYPCSYNEVNLNRFKNFKKKFIFGFSDHTLDSLSSLVAVSKGAKIIEKHFTIDRKIYKGDNKFSMEPKEFKNMIQQIRNIEKINSNLNPNPTKKEIRNRLFSHRFLASKKDIKVGEKFSLKNVAFMRFGKTNDKLLSPAIFEKIKNKKSKFFFKKGNPIKIKN